MTRPKSGGTSPDSLLVGTRPLTAGEITLARRVFADGIDYDRVRIHGSNYVFWQGANYVVTPNGQMYLGRNLRRYADFSTASLSIQAFFIHEMTHVWQHQCGVNVLRRGIGEQIRHFLGFNQYRYRLEPGKPLTAYKLEQQGDIMRDYFLALMGQATPYGITEYVAALGRLPDAPRGPTIV
ncbi:MAG: hypothetical protein JO278_06230 [Dyella sp.]|nr:hypothetical protein [Dyella sp.]